MKILLRYSFILILVSCFKNTSANHIAVSVAGSDATLKSIVLSTATSLVFSTGSSDFNYTTSVSPGTASLTVTPTTDDPAATVTVNGVIVKSGSQSAPITLNGIVTTTINMLVTASDGVTTHSYSIVVYETGSNNAFLSSLSISTGNALVASSTGSGTFNYTTSVSLSITSLTVTASTSSSFATLTVNGVAVTSGNPSGSITLNGVGNTTTITVVVLAQDGVTTQSYCIYVSQTGSNDATLSSIELKTNAAGNIALTATGMNSYTANVKSTTTYIEVEPTSTDGTATITVNGTAVASGSFSGQITVFPATITILSTAQDGITTQTYTLIVSNNATSSASLSSILTSANSVLVASGSNYTTDVNPSVSSLTVTSTLSTSSAGATITVAVGSGTPVPVSSGQASSALTLNAIGTPTVINVMITSQDGLTTTTITITVNRNGSNDDLLNKIVLSSNTNLASTTGTSNINYKTSVNSSLTSLTVTAFAADTVDGVTITIAAGSGTPVPVTSGQASGSLALNPIGTPTVIYLAVTAQDGSTLSISITVSRNGSNNANLSNITLSSNSNLGASRGSSTTNYVTSVSSTLTSLTITPTAADPSATITIAVNSGTPVSISSGVASSPITLAAIGSTTNVLLTIVSPDRTVTNTVSIIISRNGNNNANLTSTTLSTNTALTGATGPYHGNYTSIVSPHTLSLTVTPIASDPKATITINGLAAVSGSPSYPITLNNGSTLIVIQVTAQDGVTTNLYGITVNRTGTLYVWNGAATTIVAGTTSLGDWKNPSNWNNAGKVPTSSDVVSFGETAYSGNQPVISTGTSAIGEMYFGSATPTTLTINAGNKITVGTSLNIDQGAVATIKSSSTSSAYIYIAPEATVNFADAGNGQLIINSVIFTLQSSAAGSASIGQITTNSIVGNVSVQRYITGGSTTYRGYRLLSSPVYQRTANGNNIYSLNYVQASSLITGSSASAGFNAVGNPTLYLYREDLPPYNGDFTSGNYWGISALNNPTAIAYNIPVNGIYTPYNFYFNYYLNGGATNYNLPVGNGFEFFFRGDNINNVANKFKAGTFAESVTMTTTGTVNTGPITVSDWFTPTSANLSYTNNPNIANGSVRGFNLVGNPYPSNIDWDTYNTTTPSSGIYAPNVGNYIYVLDPVSKNYGVYVANSAFGGTNNATHIISSGQGFFVQAFDPTAQLIFNEDAKTTTQVTGANLLLGKPKQNAVSQYLHLKLKQDTIRTDEIFISFDDNAQSKFVFNEDAAQKPGDGTASLASMSSDGVPLSINKLKLPKQSETIALNVNAISDGAYQLSAPEIKSIPVLFDIWLIDAYKRDSVNLRQTPTYNFNIYKSDAASYGSSRFSLVIRQNPALGIRLLDFTATKASGGAQVVWKTENEANYTNFTVERSTDGGVTFNVLGGFASSALGTYSFVDKNPLMTANRYRLKLADLNGNVTYSNIVTLIYGNSNNVAGNISIYPNPASGTINLSITPLSNSSYLQINPLQNLTSANTRTVSYCIKIINITGAVIKTATSSTPSWQDNVSHLSPGTYIIEVVNNADKSVVGKSTFVKL